MAKTESPFYGRSYFYTTANDGRRIIGVMQGLGDAWIVGYLRDNGARRALRSNRLWSTTHVDDLQLRLDMWAKERELTEVPTTKGA